MTVITTPSATPTSMPMMNTDMRPSSGLRARVRVTIVLAPDPSATTKTQPPKAVRDNITLAAARQGWSTPKGFSSEEG